MATKNKAIVVKNLSKSFNIPLEYSNGIKQKIINLFKGIKGYRVFTPLSNISFEIEEGDFFGIVGRNGSGKSTLLKTIAGIYSPDKGSIKVNGSLVPFIELGVGFNPELTGRENVFLNGALLGFSRKEMESMYSEIVDFAELNEFMDEKLKNYSSGMQVRLAFSIAIQAKGAILLLDEVLAVGDEAFQRKCFNYFAELKREKKTVVLVTHDMDTVQRFCNKAIMIDKGRVIIDGNPSKVAQEYRDLLMPKGAVVKDEKHFKKGNGFAENEFLSSNVSLNKHKDSLIFTIKTKYKVVPGSVPIVAFGIVRDTGEQVYRWASDEKLDANTDLTNSILEVTVENIFPDGNYEILLVNKSVDRSEDFGSFMGILSFIVEPRKGRVKNGYWWPKDDYLIKKIGDK